MQIPYKIISVFIDEKNGLRGNTTAVVKLERALTEEHMQLIAEDFNQPATTYIWEEDGHFKVRWFAPDAEIGLCGHGAMGAIAFLGSADQEELFFPAGSVYGQVVSQNTAKIWLQPIPTTKKLKKPEALIKGLGIEVLEYYKTDNKNIIVVESEAALRKMEPNFAVLRELETFGYTVTAPGDDVDFVSRTLVPHVQQLEDPATGSSHAALTPFWAERLKKDRLVARQLSKRGGAFVCEMANEMVALEGQFKILAEGTLNLS